MMTLMTMISCSKQEEVKAKFSFQIGALVAGAGQSGGVMVYGHNSDRTSSFGRYINGDQHTFKLKNGSWTFYAIGWDGTSPLLGNVRCGTTSADLAGTDVNIDLTMDSTGCDAKFTPPEYLHLNSPQLLDLYTCNSLSPLGVADTCDFQKGLHKSYRVVLPNYLDLTETPTTEVGLQSLCIPVNTADPISLAPTGIKLPLGGNSFPLTTEIHAFITPDCSGTNKEVYMFPKGIAQGLQSGSHQLLVDPATPNKNKLFLLSTITPIAPNPPTSISVSLGTVYVGGIVPGASAVNVFTDATCTSLIGSEPYSNSTTAVFVSFVEGTYTLYASQEVDGLESACSTVNVTYTHDVTSPVAASNLAWSGSNPSSVNSATLTWTAGIDTNGLANQKIQLFSDSLCSYQVGTPTSVGLVTSYTLSSLSEGSYYALVESSDPAGNISLSNCSGVITIDLTPPTPASGLSWGETNPTKLDMITAQWSPSLAGDVAIQNLRIYSGAGCGTLQSNQQLSGNADSSWIINSTTDQTYSFKLETQDIAGNVSFSDCSGAIVVDKTPPPAPTSLTLLNPMSSPGNMATPSFTISGVETGAKVELHRDMSCTTHQSEVLEAVATSVDLPSLTLGIEGTYTYYTKQKDVAGNYSPCSAASATYVYDSTPPIAPVVDGVTGGSDTVQDNSLEDGKTPTVHWGDVADEYQYLVSIHSMDDLTNICPEQIIAQNLISHTLIGCELTPGVGYTVRLSAKDAAGNISSITTFSFSLPHSRPIWMSMPNAPLPRSQHTTVSTGSGIIVWGGSDGTSTLDNGYRFESDTWLAIPSSTPSPRVEHTAVWNPSASTMIIWGGNNGSTTYYEDGFRLNPDNSWTNLAAAPTGSARAQHIAVWDAPRNRMIIWGGNHQGTELSDGLIYDYNLNLWSTMNIIDAPSARSNPAYAIIGDYLVVWGGKDVNGPLDTGAKYNLLTDTWTPISVSGVARQNMAFTSTTEELIVWGGSDSTASLTNTGARYDPLTDMWTNMNTLGAPMAKDGVTMAWNSKYVIVWGGLASDSTASNDGAAYDIAFDKWRPLDTTGAPEGRYRHTMTNVNNELYIFGGVNNVGIQLATGARLATPP
jgi:hypothetical protein